MDIDVEVVQGDHQFGCLLAFHPNIGVIRSLCRVMREVIMLKRAHRIRSGSSRL